MARWFATTMALVAVLACALLGLAGCAAQSGQGASASVGASASASQAVPLGSEASVSQAVSSSSAASASASSQVASSSSAPVPVQTHNEQGGSLMYLGQGSVRITTPEGKVIYVDPYAGEDAWYSLPADLILVTHAHFDHTALDRVAQRNPHCQVITQVEALAGGERRAFDFDYATVIPVQAGFNNLHSVDECVGYVVELTDGTKVYLSGDTSTTDDMRDGTLAALNIDYAFWCTDGVYNMGNDEAAEAARLVGAAHNIPYHNATTDSGEMFNREAAEAFAAPNALVLQPGQDVPF